MTRYRRILGPLALLMIVSGASFVLAQGNSIGGVFQTGFNYVIGGQWTWRGQAIPFIFEGTTDDPFETSLAVTNPTADRTFTIPNVASDTFVFKNSTDILTNKTLTAPVLGGSVTGTYTLAGTPTITAPAMTSPVITGKPTIYSTVTTYTGATDAIDIALGDVFMLSRAGAADAATLADPAVGDNGRIIRIYSGTAFAHTITITNGIGGAGGTDDVITFTNRISAGITLFAHNGKWYVVGANLAAIA